MVLKGVMTIELTDETTGAVETVMEERVKNKVDFWTHLYKGS